MAYPDIVPDIGIMVRVFANSSGDLTRDIPKTLKMALDASLLSSQRFKVWIKGKEVAPSLHIGVVAIE